MFRLLSVVGLVSVASGFSPVARTAFKVSSKTSPTAVAPTQGVVGYPRQTELEAMLTETELPEKLYFPKEKETPKVLGGLQIGLRKLVCITGASSGLGLNCAATLAKTGRYFVVMACRNVEKAKEGECLFR